MPAPATPSQPGSVPFPVPTPRSTSCGRNLAAYVRVLLYALCMAEKRDALLVAWVLAGETLARLDRRRMAALLEVAREVAEAHGASDTMIGLLTGAVDLDQSTAN